MSLDLESYLDFISIRINCSEILYRIQLRLWRVFCFGYPIDSVPFTELHKFITPLVNIYDTVTCRVAFVDNVLLSYTYIIMSSRCLIVDTVMLTTFIVRI